ncbi:hypothetical protein NE237_014334 [Protea cynaroides]|uniref:Uncharacterized protein n=1 Tax=Protea cynaroides TaxID=273540 RepID=A0A9Q0QQ19_9MAGN|nr:hypothetical protein NE237_014334 [Protea cynaroides]
MGCGESKHDVVAADNTVVHRRKPNFNKKHKDLGTIPEAEPDAEKESESEKEVEAVAASNVKDILVNSELKIEGKELQAQDMLSPDRFYSSRRDEDAIKAIVDEIGSGYCTPRHEPDKDGFFDEDADAEADTEEHKLKQN